jgi:transposase
MDDLKLPDDILALKNIILNDRAEILRLQDIIDLLKRKYYAPQSEVVSSDQLGLFNEIEEIEAENGDDEGQPEEKETITYDRRKNKRAKVPAHLPRVEVIIDIPDEEKFCPQDGKALKRIGEEISEELEIIPAKVFVKRTIRPKYSCPYCQEGVKCSPPPVTLLPKSMASSSLLSYIIISKFMDALPLYRQEGIFTRIGATLTRQTMARWLIKVYEQLMPLYNLLQDKILERNYLQMDETYTQVLKEENKKATSRSYMWVRLAPGDHPIVLYDYSPTRSSTVPTELLQGFEGYLQVDGYDGYAPFCSSNPKVIRLGCMDHARRKFRDAFGTANGKNIGKKALIYFKNLYKIEKKIEGLSIQERFDIRQEESKPILEEMRDWLEKLSLSVTPQSVSGKAINYALNEWAYLIGYVEDGNLRISNALVENSIRPFALGRKNWLFSASVDGAKASAMYFSLIETAKANNIDPFLYFNEILEKLPHAKALDDFEKLLPLKRLFNPDQ